jgi:hypothetical protein
MGARDLMAALTGAGITLRIDGHDALCLEPASRLTAELRQRVRESKADLLALLRIPLPPSGYSPAELHRLVRLWHERAGLDPGQAERIIALLRSASPMGAESEYEHWRQMVADQARIAARKDANK